MAMSDEQVRSEIAVQAGDWFVRHQVDPLAAEDNAALFDWLRASPMHVEEYLGVARVAQRLKTKATGPQETLDEFLASQGNADDGSVVRIAGPTASATARQRHRVHVRYLRIAASVLLVGSALVWWKHDGELLGIPKTYQTAHGEQRARLLPDGSVLRLDTDSAVTVRYSRRERLVEVVAGQALFEVAHGDKDRWFRVTAGDAGAIALGTRFNVYRRERASEFTVAEGEIGVYAGQPPEFHRSAGLPAALRWRVPAGYRLRIDGNQTSAQPVPADLSQVLGWLQHRIVFEHWPLAEVAAEFNRYARTPLIVEDARLAALPLSGSFDADDTEAFVAYVERLPGARLERSETRIRVLSEESSN